MMNTLFRKALFFGFMLHSSGAFVPSSQSTPWGVQQNAASVDSNTALHAKIEDIEDIGYTVKVTKPLGVVFGENQEPFAGLRVDEIEDGSEGERVGIKYGDQLMAVNGDICIDEDFDTAMAVLRNAPQEMELLLYKGPAKNMYKILTKERGVSFDADDEDVPVMDENYESPVQIDVTEQREFDLGRAFSRLAGGGKKDDKKDKETTGASKEGGGLFGGLFNQETIQLEGKDATGTGKSK